MQQPLVALLVGALLVAAGAPARGWALASYNDGGCEDLPELVLPDDGAGFFNVTCHGDTGAAPWTLYNVVDDDDEDDAYELAKGSGPGCVTFGDEWGRERSVAVLCDANVTDHRSLRSHAMRLTLYSSTQCMGMVTELYFVGDWPPGAAEWSASCSVDGARREAWYRLRDGSSVNAAADGAVDTACEEVAAEVAEVATNAESFSLDCAGEIAGAGPGDGDGDGSGEEAKCWSNGSARTLMFVDGECTTPMPGSEIGAQCNRCVQRHGRDGLTYDTITCNGNGTEWTAVQYRTLKDCLNGTNPVGLPSTGPSSHCVDAQFFGIEITCAAPLPGTLVPDALKPELGALDIQIYASDDCSGDPVDTVSARPGECLPTEGSPMSVSLTCNLTDGSWTTWFLPRSAPGDPGNCTFATSFGTRVAAASGAGAACLPPEVDGGGSQLYNCTARSGSGPDDRVNATGSNAGGGATPATGDGPRPDGSENSTASGSRHANGRSNRGRAAWVAVVAALLGCAVILGVVKARRGCGEHRVVDSPGDDEEIALAEWSDS